MGRVPSQRYDSFRLNSNSQFWRGLVFAGLGAHPGTTLFSDSSAFQNHGAFAGGMPASAWDADPYLGRRCIRWTATNHNQSVTIPRRQPLEPPTGITTACWAKVVTLGGTNVYAVFFDKAYTSHVDPYYSYTYRIGYDNTLYCYVKTAAGAAGGQRGTGTATLLGTWRHYACTYDGANIQMYLDGAPAGAAFSQTGSIAYYAKDWILGRFANLSSTGYTGSLGDPCIWDRALAREELRALADPGNVDYRLAGVPLILPVRRIWPAATAARFRPEWAAYTNQYVGIGV